MLRNDVREGMPVLVKDMHGAQYQRGTVEPDWEYGPDLMWILCADGTRRPVMIERSEALPTGFSI